MQDEQGADWIEDKTVSLRLNNRTKHYAEVFPWLVHPPQGRTSEREGGCCLAREPGARLRSLHAFESPPTGWYQRGCQSLYLPMSN